MELAYKDKPAIKGNSCRIVCDYHHERRPFTAADAARVICYAREGGAEFSEILARAELRCGPLPDECAEEREELERFIKLVELLLEAVALGIPALAGMNAIVKARRATLLAADARAAQKAGKVLTTMQDVVKAAEAEYKDLIGRISRPIVIKQP